MGEAPPYTARDVVVALSDSEVRLISQQAEATVGTFSERLADGGGRSHFRENRADTIAEDGLVGQAAALAGCKWLYGNSLGHYIYRTSRWAAARAPLTGDGGSDVPGANVDFKGSLMRNSDRPLAGYHLPVRPRERHADAVYIRILIEAGFRTCHLVGWATDAELPGEVETVGVFRGAYVLPVTHLHPCPPFRWAV